MNYYKRHIGDYMKDAGHLSLLEHGVYTRLMDVYYTRETGIPVDQAARLIGARSKDELSALAQVTAEFFSVVDGVYTQGRCNRVIGEMLDKAETNRVVGKRGGRPKKVTEAVDSANPEITQMVSENNPDETLATSHKPLTNINTGDSARKRTPPAARPPDVSEPVWHDFLSLRKTKRAPLTSTAMAGLQAEAAKAGIGLEQALSYCCLVGWQGFNAAWYAERMADQPTAKAQAAPRETFRERDKRQQEEKWEQMTGRQHPNSRRADVLDTTATTVATASIAKPTLALTTLETTA